MNCFVGLIKGLTNKRITNEHMIKLYNVLRIMNVCMVRGAHVI